MAECGINRFKSESDKYTTGSNPVLTTFYLKTYNYIIMELDELFETKRNLEMRIENFFDGEQIYIGDRNYQSLLERLEEVEEEIHKYNH